jgi:DNA-binding NtrC family response regulator
MPTSILLIDPDEITRTVLKYHLVRAGYVVHALDCPEAAFALSGAGPSLVVADEAVAGSLWLDADRDWRYRDVPALVLTNLPPAHRVVASRTYLAKPVRSGQLLSSVAQLAQSKG